MAGLMTSPANSTKRIMTVFGTRPEAIKMFPVVHALRAQPGIDARVCVTAQHRDLLPAGGRVLAVADGEGRNSVWLAQQGMQVDAFDISAWLIHRLSKLQMQAIGQVV